MVLRRPRIRAKLEPMGYEPPPGVSRADIFGFVLLMILTAFLIWG